MSDNYFDISKIKTFDWPDLDGKELTIITATDSGVTVIAGLEKSTGLIYIIASKQEATE
jgi:hypothetical protein